MHLSSFVFAQSCLFVYVASANVEQPQITAPPILARQGAGENLIGYEYRGGRCEYPRFSQVLSHAYQDH